MVNYINIITFNYNINLYYSLTNYVEYFNNRSPFIIVCIRIGDISILLDKFIDPAGRYCSGLKKKL